MSTINTDRDYTQPSPTPYIWGSQSQNSQDYELPPISEHTIKFLPFSDEDGQILLSALNSDPNTFMELVEPGSPSALPLGFDFNPAVVSSPFSLSTEEPFTQPLVMYASSDASQSAGSSPTISPPATSSPPLTSSGESYTNHSPNTVTNVASPQMYVAPQAQSAVSSQNGSYTASIHAAPLPNEVQHGFTMGIVRQMATPNAQVQALQIIPVQPSPPTHSYSPNGGNYIDGVAQNGNLSLALVEPDKQKLKRRESQNQASRNYRQRKKDHISQVETQLEKYQAEIMKLRRENGELRCKVLIDNMIGSDGDSSMENSAADAVLSPQNNISNNNHNNGNNRHDINNANNYNSINSSNNHNNVNNSNNHNSSTNSDGHNGSSEAAQQEIKGLQVKLEEVKQEVMNAKTAMYHQTVEMGRLQRELMKYKLEVAELERTTSESNAEMGRLQGEVIRLRLENEELQRKYVNDLQRENAELKCMLGTLEPGQKESLCNKQTIEEYMQVKTELVKLDDNMRSLLEQMNQLVVSHSLDAGAKLGGPLDLDEQTLMGLNAQFRDSLFEREKVLTSQVKKIVSPVVQANFALLEHVTGDKVKGCPDDPPAPELAQSTHGCDADENSQESFAAACAHCRIIGCVGTCLDHKETVGSDQKTDDMCSTWWLEFIKEANISVEQQASLRRSFDKYKDKIKLIGKERCLLNRNIKAFFSSKLFNFCQQVAGETPMNTKQVPCVLELTLNLQALKKNLDSEKNAQICALTQLTQALGPRQETLLYIRAYKDRGGLQNFKFLKAVWEAMGLNCSDLVEPRPPQKGHNLNPAQLLRMSGPARNPSAPWLSV